MTDKDTLKENIQDLYEGLTGIDDVRIIPESILAPVEDNKYSMIRQDTVTNKLVRLSSKSGLMPEDFTNRGLIKTSTGSTDLTVIIKEYANVTLKNSTSKLLRVLTIKFTERGDKLIKIPLKEYMELTGLKDEKEARKNIKADLEALHNITCEARISNKGSNKGDYIRFEIIAERGIKNGVIFANFTDSIYAHLMTCPVMPYANDLLKIPNKLPYAFYLGDKITELMKYNQRKPYFTASVKKLLQVCYDNGMPTYEEVQSTDRAVDRKIITPFENNLDACSHIFDWEYCNEQGTPLTDAQLKDRTFKDFEARYIKITFKGNYPVAEFDVKKCKQADKKKAKKEDQKTA